MSTYRDAVVLTVLILAGALVLGAFAVSTARRSRWLLWLSLAGAVAVILWLTLALEFGDAGGTGLNLRPFQEIRRALDTGQAHPWVNLVGNVALFIPIGALVAWLARRGRVLAATSVGLLFSVGIELTQLSLGRVADVDDVILNTAGAFLGGVAGVAWARAVRPRQAGYDEPRASSSVGRAADF